MNIKQDSSAAIAAFLAKGNQITDCGSSMKQARSLKAMRRDDENGIVNGRRVDSVDFRLRQARAIEARQDGRGREE
jgi:hypothetical protein